MSEHDFIFEGELCHIVEHRRNCQITVQFASGCFLNVYAGRFATSARRDGRRVTREQVLDAPIREFDNAALVSSLAARRTD